jgi:hypothetical protein
LVRRTDEAHRALGRAGHLAPKAPLACADLGQEVPVVVEWSLSVMAAVPEAEIRELVDTLRQEPTA